MNNRISLTKCTFKNIKNLEKGIKYYYNVRAQVQLADGAKKQRAEMHLHFGSFRIYNEYEHGEFETILT